MITRTAFDFTDQQLITIARAIDGDKKRRKGAAPRKAKRAECVGFITGAVKDALAWHAKCHEAQDSGKAEAPEPGAAAGRPFTLGKEPRVLVKPEADYGTTPGRFNPQKLAAGLPAPECFDADDPICIRKGCGQPKSKHGKRGWGCPGVKVFRPGVFDSSTRNEYEK